MRGDIERFFDEVRTELRDAHGRSPEEIKEVDIGEAVLLAIYENSGDSADVVALCDDMRRTMCRCDPAKDRVLHILGLLQEFARLHLKMQ